MCGVINIVSSRPTARTAELRGHLRALSPQATLDRGYAIVQDAAGRVVRAPADAPDGEEVVVTLAEGVLAAVSRGEADDPHRGDRTATGPVGAAE
jgi:exodeoxyribonuclease VII large subunit